MQRYFLNEQTDKEHITFQGEDYHHMVRVMRMQQADECLVVLGDRQVGRVRIREITETVVYADWIETIEKTVELPVNVTIACGLPKGDKLDWITQKVTELGAYAIQPFESSWSVVRWEAKKQEKKRQRLQKIAKEAAEQSHRVHIPTVEQLLSFNQFVQKCRQYDKVLVAYEEDGKQQEKTAFKTAIKQVKPEDNILIVFGSEGGLSPQEINQLIACGAQTCGLGPRIMRAETAPLYVLSVLSYELELGEK